MTIYNRTKLCDSPLSTPREMEVRRGRARQGWRETVWGGETGGGGRMPHLHTFLRDIARHCGRWNKALSSVLFPFVVQVRGINKNVSRCWEARACGRKVIDVGWLTHPDFPTSHNGSQSIRRAWLQCRIVNPQRWLNTAKRPMFPAQLITLWWTLPTKFPKENSF